MQHCSLVYPVSDCRSEPLPSTPPKRSPPVPQRATPTLSYTDIDHPDVQRFFAHLAFVFSAGPHHYIPPSSPAVFALAALDVIRCGPTHPAHAFFWSPTQRAATAATVQRVINSGTPLIIPYHWTSPAAALATLAAREAERAAASLKRKAAHARGAKEAEPPQKVQRVTRASARQQTQAQTQATPAASSSATPTPTGETKRRRTPPAAIATETSQQRASARQQKQRAEVQLPSPPAVVPPPPSPPRPTHIRARSSSETLVPPSASSRAASVSSADTLVVVASSKKGKARADADADETAPETTRVTRSRAKTTTTTSKAARTTPYPATKSAQLAAGRGKAPTGKRKTAKAQCK